MSNPGEDLKCRLLGTRKLVSAVREEIPSGRKTDFFHNYSLEGRMFALIVRGDRKRPASAVAAPAEIEALFKSAVSYTDRYSVGGNEVSHHVDASLNEIWTGTVQRRTAIFDGARLQLSPPPSLDPLDGWNSVRTMTRERDNTRVILRGSRAALAPQDDALLTASATSTPPTCVPRNHDVWWSRPSAHRYGRSRP